MIFTEFEEFIKNIQSNNWNLKDAEEAASYLQSKNSEIKYIILEYNAFDDLLNFYKKHVPSLLDTVVSALYYFFPEKIVELLEYSPNLIFEKSIYNISYDTILQLANSNKQTYLELAAQLLEQKINTSDIDKNKIWTIFNLLSEKVSDTSILYRLKFILLNKLNLPVEDVMVGKPVQPASDKEQQIISDLLVELGDSRPIATTQKQDIDYLTNRLQKALITYISSNLKTKLSTLLKDLPSANTIIDHILRNMESHFEVEYSIHKDFNLVEKQTPKHFFIKIFIFEKLFTLKGLFDNFNAGDIVNTLNGLINDMFDYIISLYKKDLIEEYKRNNVISKLPNEIWKKVDIKVDKYYLTREDVEQTINRLLNDASVVLSEYQQKRDFLKVRALLQDLYKIFSDKKNHGIISQGLPVYIKKLTDLDRQATDPKIKQQIGLIQDVVDYIQEGLGKNE